MSPSGPRRQRVESIEVGVELFYTKSVDRFHARVYPFPVKVTAIIEYSAKGKKHQKCWPQKVRITQTQQRAISTTSKGKKAFIRRLSDAFELQENVRLDWNGVTLEELLEVRGD